MHLKWRYLGRESQLASKPKLRVAIGQALQQVTRCKPAASGIDELDVATETCILNGLKYLASLLLQVLAEGGELGKIPRNCGITQLASGSCRLRRRLRGDIL